jgi:hypothetical protein
MRLSHVILKPAKPDNSYAQHMSGCPRVRQHPPESVDPVIEGIRGVPSSLGYSARQVVEPQAMVRRRTHPQTRVLSVLQRYRVNTLRIRVCLPVSMSVPRRPPRSLPAR